MLYRHLIEGDIYGMLPIYILWFVSIILIAILANRLIAKDSAKTSKTKSLSELILFLGSFTLLFGVFWQVTGLLQALTAIEIAGDISPALIAEGLKVSSYAPTYGFILFIITFVAWFVARRVNK